MIHVTMPYTSRQRRLPFYLAMEEWVARTLPANDYFFTWIVDPTVICGRNQDVRAEVDLQYCSSHGIDVCRRRSGGGCVYADRGNIMISCITPADTDVPTAFSRYSERVASALQAMGLNASATGRNDVLIDGRKVSGGAFYHIPGRSIMHSTMLYSTAMENMLHAITPSRAKLESKKVRSVESRITTISEHLPSMPIEKFHAGLIEQIATGSFEIKAGQIKEIEYLEQAYYKPQWLYGRSNVITDSLLRMRREFIIEGAGSLQIDLALDNGRISDVDFSGDFFTLADVETEVIAKIRGVVADRASIEAALCGAKASNAIAGLSASTLADCLWQTCTNKT